MSQTDTLFNEVQEIGSQGALPVHFEWTMEIYIEALQMTLVPYRVLSIDVLRDYANNYCDEMTAQIALGAGTYQQYVVPNAKNLLVTLIRHPVLEGGSVDKTQSIEKQSYRGVLTLTHSSTVQGDSIIAGTLNAANMSGMVQVNLQLLDLAIEQTRMLSFGTAFRSIKVLDAITYSIVKISQTLQVDAQHKVKGVDTVDANNTEVYSSIVIPHGTRAVDVPRYIAHFSGSPYSSGFGAYLQNAIWYVYPLYDLKRYDNETKRRTLTIINVPSNRYPNADRTFRITAKQVILMASESNRHIDLSDAVQGNEGTGSRYLDANKAFDGFASMDNNKATIKRVDNANEYIAEKKDYKLNNVQQAATPVTGNTYEAMSKMTAGLGSLLLITWYSSEMNLIYPGMPAQYKYTSAGEVFTLKGVVIKTQTQIAQTTTGLIPGPHRSATILTLFVEKILDWKDAQAVPS